MNWFLVSAVIVVAFLLVLLSPVYPVRVCHPKKGKTLVAVTFDDGYKCWISDVLPIMANSGLKATAFINDLDHRQGITWGEAQKLHEAGWEIGWHTSLHTELYLADSAAIVNDFRNSKALFRSHGLPEPLTFAYPYGRHDLKSMEIASRYFVAARTVHHGINNPCYLNDNPYHLKAIGLNSGLSFVKRQIKKYSNDRVLFIIFAHTVGKDAGWREKPEMTVKDFEALVKFLQQEKQNGDIDVVTLVEGLTRIKEENAHRSWGLKFDSPWDKWCRLGILPIPRRYVTICETVLDDYIGHRLPRISRLVHQLARSLKFA